MFGFSFLDAIKVGAGAAVALAVALAYNHYTGLLKDRETLKQNVATLESALTVEKAATEAAVEKVDEWRTAFTNLQEDIQALSETQARSRDEVRRLQSIFTEHNLGKLAEARPALIEKRINDGSRRINGLLECASGGGDNCPSEPAVP